MLHVPCQRPLHENGAYDANQRRPRRTKHMVTMNISVERDKGLKGALSSAVPSHARACHVAGKMDKEVMTVHVQREAAGDVRRPSSPTSCLCAAARPQPGPVWLQLNVVIHAPICAGSEGEEWGSLWCERGLNWATASPGMASARSQPGKPGTWCQGQTAIRERGNGRPQSHGCAAPRSLPAAPRPLRLPPPTHLQSQRTAASWARAPRRPLAGTRTAPRCWRPSHTATARCATACAPRSPPAGAWRAWQSVATGLPVAAGPCRAWGICRAHMQAQEHGHGCRCPGARPCWAGCRGATQPAASCPPGAGCRLVAPAVTPTRPFSITECHPATHDEVHHATLLARDARFVQHVAGAGVGVDVPRHHHIHLVAVEQLLQVIPAGGRDTTGEPRRGPGGEEGQGRSARTGTCAERGSCRPPRLPNCPPGRLQRRTSPGRRSGPRPAWPLGAPARLT